jgi:alpha-ketoglutarate-dependent taurine dioxygenase
MMQDGYILRVSGKKDNDGRPLGMFAEGELLWHSNESGNISFAPGVSLLGAENMINSSTGFATTVDWYESQSEAFRSELDEMIIVHKFTPGRIHPGLNAQQDHVMYRNMCPEDGVEIPLVRQSPGGLKGIHYSQNTISHVKGMTQSESENIFKLIEQGIFNDDNVYDHWYKSNSDLCIFDNSITQHRRLGDTTNRLAYRMQFNYDYLLDNEYNPYYQETYRSQFRTHKEEVNRLLRQHGL